jgi:hypothetical protein
LLHVQVQDLSGQVSSLQQKLAAAEAAVARSPMHPSRSPKAAASSSSTSNELVQALAHLALQAHRLTSHAAVQKQRQQRSSLGEEDVEALNAMVRGDWVGVGGCQAVLLKSRGVAALGCQFASTGATWSRGAVWMGAGDLSQCHCC